MVLAANSLSRCSFGAAARRVDVIFDLAGSIEAIVKSSAADEAELCIAVAEELACALRDPSWIPLALREPARDNYRRELLFEAEDGSFSVGCFVWGVGQRSPIHDHRGWSVLGCAFGSIESQSYYRSTTGTLLMGTARTLLPGECHWGRPAVGDIHSVYAKGGRTAVSVHAYGCRFAEVTRLRYSASGEVLPQ